MGIQIRMSDSSYRQFSIQVPLDWTDHVGVEGLPVLVFLGDTGHTIRDLTGTAEVTSILGKNPQELVAGPDDDKVVLLFLEPQLSPPPPPLATQLIDLELDAFVPDWDVGFNRPDSDPTSEVEVECFWAALERAEAMLQVPYGQRAAYFGVPEVGVIDRSRVYVIGVGTGGVMAYRLAAQPPPDDWRIPSICVINGTIGGFMHTRDYDDPTREVWYGPVARGATVSSGLVDPPWILHIRGADDAIMANHVQPISTNLLEEPLDGRGSLGSQTIHFSIQREPLLAGDYARFDFYMETGLDAWCVELYGEEKKFSDEVASGGWTTLPGTTGVQVIAFDDAGNLDDTLTPGVIPPLPLVGILVDGLDHAVPTEAVHGIGLDMIWTWLKAAP